MNACPVCGGTGKVPNGFYSQVGGEWSTSDATPEQCRSCHGTGIIAIFSPSASRALQAAIEALEKMHFPGCPNTVPETATCRACDALQAISKELNQ